MKRTVYEAPVTERFQVELEGAFMAASVISDKESSDITVKGHEENTIDGSQWDNVAWE